MAAEVQYCNLTCLVMTRLLTFIIAPTRNSHVFTTLGVGSEYHVFVHVTPQVSCSVQR